MQAEVRCPNCNDLIDTAHNPTNCLKCNHPLPGAPKPFGEMRRMLLFVIPSILIFFLLTFAVAMGRWGNLSIAIPHSVGFTIPAAALMLGAFYVTNRLQNKTFAGFIYIVFYLVVAGWTLFRR